MAYPKPNFFLYFYKRSFFLDCRFALSYAMSGFFHDTVTKTYKSKFTAFIIDMVC